MSARKYVNRFVLAYGSLSVRSSKLKVIDHWLGPVQNRQQFERVKGSWPTPRRTAGRLRETKREGKGRDIFSRPPSCDIPSFARLVCEEQFGIGVELGRGGVRPDGGYPRARLMQRTRKQPGRAQGFLPHLPPVSTSRTFFPMRARRGNLLRRQVARA